MGLRDRDPGGYTPMSDDEETDDPLVADAIGVSLELDSAKVQGRAPPSGASDGE
jgi:hypothetical protein